MPPKEKKKGKGKKKGKIKSVERTHTTRKMEIACAQVPSLLMLL
jgi:hypothetical protein